jgi:hypothetical protein
MFAYPYFLLFEFLGAPLELAGYLILPFFHLLGILSIPYLGMFILASAGFGTVVSVAAVVSGAWPESGGEGLKGPQASLLRYRGADVAILLLYAFLENFGYRQMTLWWRLRGIWDFLFTDKGWEKFERKGFGEPATAEEAGG